MSKNHLFKSLLILAISISTVGCKLKQEVGDIDKQMPGIEGIKPSAARNFTASELEIGRRMCSNLKKKREFFETLSNEKEQFRFRGELKNCDNGIYNSALFIASISNANSTEPEYIASREKYFKDVTTDQNGVMKTLCDAMITSDVVSNNILSSNYKYSINFLIADGFDTYQVFKGQKNANGAYDTLSLESVALISNKNQAPVKFLGVEKERVRYTMCDAAKYHTQRQTWVEAITTF